MRAMRSRPALFTPMRLAPLLAALVAACSAPAPAASPPAPTAAVTSTPTPTVARPPVKARSVAVVGGAVVATGDFRGVGDTQVAIVEDPSANLAVRISLRDTLAGSSPPVVWFESDPNFLALARAKFAVADVDFDARDDLVALYDGGANTSRLYVFRSEGTGFAFAGAWWSGDYTWSRATNVVAGRFSGDGRDSLLVTYQDDGERMRVLSFEPDGKAFAPPTAVYDSGVGQFDLARTRVAVGRFTRAAGADQLVALTQSGTRAKLSVLEPSPKGLVRSGVLETDVEYDVTRATIVGADVVGDGRDEIVTLYVDADGGARVLVLEPAADFRPSNGWNGWATLPAGAVCGGPGAFVVGDWDRDGRADAAALAPTGRSVRAQLLTTGAAAFTVASTADDGLLCPTWPLTGAPLGFGDATARPVYVKIDNNPSARPHYGLSKADMVYEWLVEGLTTRLAAVFQSRQPDVIGSVRSVRMTDRHVLPSLGAVLVYSGGGPEELMAINYDAAVGRRYVDLSPRYGWGYRADSRDPPYNFFTTYDAVRRAIDEAPDGGQPAIVAPWRFLPTGEGDPLAGGFAESAVATTVTIPYRARFEVVYRYDDTTRTYARFDDGVREVDAANGDAIAARNVLVIQTEVRFTDEFGLDPAGNQKLAEVLTGSGKGVLFRDGRRQDVIWTRPDVVDSFALRTPRGETVLLAPGQTWIHVVPDDWTIPSE